MLKPLPQKSLYTWQAGLLQHACILSRHSRKPLALGRDMCVRARRAEFKRRNEERSLDYRTLVTMEKKNYHD